MIISRFGPPPTILGSLHFQSPPPPQPPIVPRSLPFLTKTTKTPGDLLGTQTGSRKGVMAGTTPGPLTGAPREIQNPQTQRIHPPPPRYSHRRRIPTRKILMKTTKIMSPKKHWWNPCLRTTDSRTRRRLTQGTTHDRRRRRHYSITTTVPLTKGPAPRPLPPLSLSSPSL